MTQVRSTLLTLIGLVVLAGAAGLYAWKGLYTPDHAEAERKEYELKLLAARAPGSAAVLDAGEPWLDFERLSVTLDGHTSVLEKAPGGAWRLTAPVAARADQEVVGALVSQLRTARFKSALEEHPDEATLRTYGLDHPRFRVEAEATAGPAREPRRVALEGGLENSFDGSSFVRRDGQAAVYSAEGGLRAALARSTFDLRDKQVLALDEASLGALAVRSRTVDWALERDQANRWRFSRPTAELAEASEVSALVSAATSTRALAFPTDTEGLRPLFAHRLLEATGTLRDGGVVTLTLARASGDAGERWFARRDDAEGLVVAEVGPAATSALDRSARSLEDRTVLRFEPGDVATVVLHSEGSEVVLTRELSDAGLEGWRVVAPRPGPARSSRITALLRTLATLKARSWGEPPPRDRALSGVESTRRWISLRAGDGGELARLTLGGPAPTPDLVQVRGTRPQVALVERALLAELPFDVSELLEAAPDAGRSP
jgi:hypothetical protein